MTTDCTDDRTGDQPGDRPEELLTLAVQRRREAQSLEKRLVTTRERLAADEAEAARLAARLGDEERDVRRLESLSWSRTWSALRGSHADDLSREQAERDAAAYAAAVADARVSTTREELAVLERQRADLGDVDAGWRAALAVQETWLVDHDPVVGRRLVEIAEERGRIAAEDRETSEAHAAGSRAHGHLSDAAASLSSARSWSTWDTFGGGGLLTDAMKYDRLDQVGEDLRRADLALRTFTAELADVHLPAVEALEIGSLTRTFDVWFDNIFSDWAVRDRIVQAEDRVRRALTQVTGVLNGLADRGQEIGVRFQELGDERLRLLGG